MRLSRWIIMDYGLWLMDFIVDISRKIYYYGHPSVTRPMKKNKKKDN
jgi:hypothetical protein